MKDFKIVYAWNAILRMVAFICITYAAVYFNRIAILLFYLVPMFMGVSWEGNKGTDA